MDLLQIVGVLFRGKWIVIATTILTVGAAVAYLKLIPPVYRATALLEVPRTSRNFSGIDVFPGEDYAGDEVLKTVERKLQRVSLLRQVLERDEILKNPSLQAGLDEPIAEMDSLELADLFKEEVNIGLAKGTRLIAVSVEHEDPAFAQLVANAIVDEFTSEISETSSGTSQSDFEFLVGEAERIGEKLQASQAKFQTYQEVIAAREKIDEQKDALDILTQRYGENHPTVVQARSLLSSLTNKYNKSLRRIRSSLGEDAGAEVPGVDTEDAEFELVQSRHKVLTGEVETSQALFAGILSRMKETDVTKQLNTAEFELAESALLPTKPVPPGPVVVLAVALVLGVVGGLFLVMTLHLKNRTLRTVVEAQKVVGLRVIGAIPWERRQGGISDPGGATAEAFRSLRAELVLLEEKENSHCYLVTSAVPGEGKSFVAANLAVAFGGQLGRKTLLVDAGLRRPAIDKIFDLDDVGDGLAGVLGGDGDWQSAVRESGFDNLDVLPAGSEIDKPAELLSGHGLALLLQELGQRYQCVVIDSSAVNSVADGLLLAGQAGKSILVAAADQTHRDAVKRACELLTNVGSKPVGLVINRLPLRSGLLGNPYHYHFGAAGKSYRQNYRRS